MHLQFCCLFQSEDLSGMFNSLQPQTLRSLLLLGKVEKLEPFNIRFQKSDTTAIPCQQLSSEVTAGLLSGVVKVLMCMTLNFSFFPLTFAFPFTVVSHNTLLLNLSAGLDSWFYLCFQSSLINTLLASSELKTRQKIKIKRPLVIGQFLTLCYI